MAFNSIHCKDTNSHPELEAFHASVVQLARASAFHAECCGFKSRHLLQPEDLKSSVQIVSPVK